MNHRGVVLWAFLAASLISGCDTAPIKSLTDQSIPEGRMVDRVPSGVYKPGIYAIGEANDLNRRRAQGYGLLHAPQLTAYMNNVRDKLLKAADVEQVTGHVWVAIDREFGAMSTPDGNIYLNMGIVESLESEDELAAVLAHELAHVLLRHHDSDAFVDAQKHMVAGAEILYDVREFLSKLTGDKTASGESEQEEDKKKLRTAKLVVMVSENVVAPAWTRGQEEEADLLAIDLLVKSDYNYIALLNVLDKQIQWEEQVNVNKRADAEKSIEPANFSEAIDKAKEEIGRIWSAVRKTHPDPEKRREVAGEYLGREYYDVVPHDFTAKKWQHALRAQPTRTIFDNYAHAFKAVDAAANGDTALAVKEGRLAIHNPTSRHAFPRLALAVARDTNGQKTSAIKNLELAYEAPEPALIVYAQAAKFQEESGNRKNALRLLENAYNRFYEPPNLLPELIRLHRLNGEKQKATTMALQCVAEYPDWSSSCEKAAGI